MLDRMLQQSESYRRKVALVLTFIIGVAIFSVWLVIAGFNVRKSAELEDPQADEAETVQQFRNSLPTLSQEQEVTTELSKQNAAKANEPADQKEKKSLLDRIFGN